VKGKKMASKEKFIEKLMQMASESPEFREKLIADPKSVIQERINFRLPDDLEVVVHVDTPQKLNLVLSEPKEELSELELSAVSGGVCWDDCIESSCSCT